MDTNKIENQEIINIQATTSVKEDETVAAVQESSRMSAVSSSLLPIPSISPALAPSLQESNFEKLDLLNLDKVQMSQSLPAESLLTSNVFDSKSSLRLSVTAESFHSTKTDTSSKSAQDQSSWSDLLHPKHSSSVSIGQSGSVSFKASGGSAGNDSASSYRKRGGSGWSQTASLSSRNSEDEDGLDDLKSIEGDAKLPSFLSSASLPLTPFKNQVCLVMSFKLIPIHK